MNDRAMIFTLILVAVAMICVSFSIGVALGLRFERAEWCVVAIKVNGDDKMTKEWQQVCRDKGISFMELLPGPGR